MCLNYCFGNEIYTQRVTVVCDLNKCKLITKGDQHCSVWCLEQRTYSIHICVLHGSHFQVKKFERGTTLIKGENQYQIVKGLFFSAPFTYGVYDSIYLASLRFQAPQIMNSKTLKWNQCAGTHLRTAKYEKAHRIPVHGC